MTVAGYAGMLATLAFVLGLVLLVARLAKRYLPGTVHAAGSTAFTVVQRIPLGQRQGIAVVQRGDLLIGVSVGEGGVRTLFTMPAGGSGTIAEPVLLDDEEAAHASDGALPLPFPGIAANTRTTDGMPLAAAFGTVLRDVMGGAAARRLLFGVGSLVAASLQAQQPAARPAAPAPRPAAATAPATAPTAGQGALRTLPPAAAQPGPRDLPVRATSQVPVPRPSTPAATASQSGGVATTAPNLPASQARDIAALQQRASGNPPLTTPEAQAMAGRADSMLKKFSPQMDLKVGGNAAGEGLRLSGTVGIVVMMGLLSLLPMLVLMMTGFTRILVVLHFLKQALGTQSAPPGQLLAAMALLLSGFVMGPTLSEVNKTALEPWMDGTIEQVEMMSRAVTPFKAFMVRQVRDQDLQTFVDLADIPQPESRETVPLTILMSAFVTSELRTAFQIGFALFLPFIVIDVVVGSVLMSMGMVMLPPAMISMPFKLLLFVLVDGWGLVITGLVQSFR